MALRRPAAIAILAAAVAAGLLATASPASAVEPPTCWNAEVWARPDITRTYQLYCPRTEQVELVSEPHKSRLEGLVQGNSVRFRLTPEADAPEHDQFTLRLTGAGSSRDQVVKVTNVPLTRNTPPRCDPVSVAQRTDGRTPVPLEFHVLCWDDEYDDYTLYGGGPGTHLDAPLHQDVGTSGQAVPRWHYVPTIASGQEQTTYYAIDELGARSADAPISIAVGPAVDRPPTCRPNIASYGTDFFGVNSRPGARRRFGVLCEDADGDAVHPRIHRPPSRGDLTVAQPYSPQQGWWGNQVWLDATYVPETSFEGEDRFAIVAGGPKGEGPVGEMGIISRSLPANSGGGCGWSPGVTSPDQPVTLEASCDDSDGDPILAEISSAPQHGHAAAPLMTPALFGNERLQIRYTPDPGFTGTDYLTLAISDAGGETQTLDFEIYVKSSPWSAPPVYTIGAPFDWPELHPRPTDATWLPALGQAPPVSPIDQARRALGTRKVKLVKRIGDARVYALRTKPAASARRRVLAVTCPVRCSLKSSSSVVGRGAGATKRRVSPGKAVALVLKLSSAQRARVRRAGGARAVFRLKVARKGGKTRRASVRLALRG